jgi:transcriptional regulator with XRE-family HTH domain
MGIKAVGVYLRAIREAATPKISQAAVGRACGVDERTIRLYEQGDLMPGAERLACFIDCVNANPIHVHLLLLDTTDDLDAARNYAAVWIGGGTTIFPNSGKPTPQERVYQVHQAIHQLTPDELALLVALEAGRLSHT